MSTYNLDKEPKIVASDGQQFPSYMRAAYAWRLDKTLTFKTIVANQAWGKDVTEEVKGFAERYN